MANGPNPSFMSFNGGQLPLPVKTIEYPTPEERQLLQAIDPNWKDGDPVHAELGEALRQVAQEVAAADAAYLPVSPGAPPLKISPAIPIDQLPPARRAEVMQTLRELQAVARAAPPPPTVPIPGAAPDINQAILEAQEITARRAQVHAAVAAAQSAVAPVAPVPIASVEAPPIAPTQLPPAAPAPAPAPPPPAPEPEPPAPEPEKPIAGNTNATTLVRCKHCGWDASKLSIATPTEADKRVFLASMLGTNKRFWKDVPLFGGSLIVRFQSRLTLETEAAAQQLRYDVANGLEMHEIMTRVIQYEMCASLCSLTVVTGDTVSAVDMPHMELPLSETRKDPPITNLPAALLYMHTNVLTTDALRRAVGRAFMDFRELVSKLESNSANPDFYNGIAPAI